MSGSDFTQFQGLSRDDDDAHQIVSKDNPLPVTLQSEAVATTTDSDDSEILRDRDLLDLMSQLVLEQRITNAYNAIFLGQTIKEEDL